MLVLGPSAQTLTCSRLAQERVSGSTEPSALTTHWANIEEHLRKHDESIIKKYSNDMDTLLVFVSVVHICGRRCGLITSRPVSTLPFLRPSSSNSTNYCNKTTHRLL